MDVSIEPMCVSIAEKCVSIEPIDVSIQPMDLPIGIVPSGVLAGATSLRPTGLKGRDPLDAMQGGVWWGWKRAGRPGYGFWEPPFSKESPR